MGEFFRISQYWVMYASPPKSAVVTNILGYTRNDASDDNDDDIMVDASMESKRVNGPLIPLQ